MENLKCPTCQRVMKIRTQFTDHVNSVNKKVSKQKHYQYYCTKCDDDKTGWTTTESDTLSFNF
jgi:uncharacterized C2H2 Zn-finger protein